ncbi:angiopoietin-4-like [Anopheles darlingi]|uniref:angiopoietin-4-like n=1 Tax=Anopheles darlingi TaxID=43151 RepID=UPI0020FFF5BD|nr:angiopoietin-4-like [Anopheles darlingi]
MLQIVCVLLLCAVIQRGRTNKSSDNAGDILKAPFDGEISGFGLEILLTKLDYIDHKLMLLEELKVELAQQRERMESIKESLEKLTTVITTPKTAINTTLPTRAASVHVVQIPFTSCKDVSSNVSGVYLIRVNNDSTPFHVYCEQQKFGGGWIVVQHRFDGSVDFYRNWDQYRDGFGEPDKEHWLGLERIHQLTSARPHEFLVEIKDFEGNYGYAHYDKFQVGSESDQYMLKTVGSYNGTVGDGMDHNQGEKFSTKDRDNDKRSEYHLAVDYEGAWWYGYGGTTSNLNGRYWNAYDRKSIWWWYFKSGFQGLSYTRMMIREL